MNQKQIDELIADPSESTKEKARNATSLEELKEILKDGTKIPLTDEDLEAVSGGCAPGYSRHYGDVRDNFDSSRIIA